MRSPFASFGAIIVEGCWRKTRFEKLVEMIYCRNEILFCDPLKEFT